MDTASTSPLRRLHGWLLSRRYSNALEMLQDDTDGRAAAREARLFERLAPRAFADQPLGHAATWAQLSATRELGNTAAHEGVVHHAAVQESLSQLLPQVLVSLHRAVQTSQ
jgi:hypothetical protein